MRTELDPPTCFYSELGWFASSNKFCSLYRPWFAYFYVKERPVFKRRVLNRLAFRFVEFRRVGCISNDTGVRIFRISFFSFIVTFYSTSPSDWKKSSIEYPPKKRNKSSYHRPKLRCPNGERETIPFFMLSAAWCVCVFSCLSFPLFFCFGLEGLLPQLRVKCAPPPPQEKKERRQASLKSRKERKFLYRRNRSRFKVAAKWYAQRGCVIIKRRVRKGHY